MSALRSGVLAAHVLTILAVDDVARAARFYRDAFGWPVAVEVPVYVELALPGGLRLGLYARDAWARHPGAAPVAIPAGALAPAELYLRVDDVATATARAVAAGARLLSAPAARDWGDVVAYLADPDGVVVALAAPAG